MCQLSQKTGPRPGWLDARPGRPDVAALATPEKRSAAKSFIGDFMSEYRKRARAAPVVEAQDPADLEDDALQRQLLQHFGPAVDNRAVTTDPYASGAVVLAAAPAAPKATATATMPRAAKAAAAAKAADPESDDEWDMDKESDVLRLLSSQFPYKELHALGASLKDFDKTAQLFVQHLKSKAGRGKPLSNAVRTEFIAPRLFVTKADRASWFKFWPRKRSEGFFKKKP